MKRKLQTPLRYPGGKARIADKLCGLFPQKFKEYREPFIGGGSIVLNLVTVTDHQRKNANFWVNDLNPEVSIFWQVAKDHLPALVDLVSSIYSEYKNSNKTGEELFAKLRTIDNSMSNMERAARFFILNRITYSGTTESGGFSQSAFKGRFTESAIERLANLEQRLDQVVVSNLDYSEVVNSCGEEVFIYCDPPYLSATESRLYGKRGSFHTNFNHEEFARIMRRSPHKWLITYDDSPVIRDLFSFANIQEWQLRYSMNTKRSKTTEIYITNY